jgi:hypothetical protein
MTWFNIAAGLASIAGLVFSIKAWIEARRAAQKADRASQAAQEARDAVTVRALVDEFQLAGANADQLLDFLTHDRLAEASLRAIELTSALSEIPFRRSPYLTVERKNELLSVRRNARTMSGILASSQQAPLSNEQKQRLIRLCQKISITLRENLGTIKGEIDKGAQQ